MVFVLLVASIVALVLLVARLRWHPALALLAVAFGTGLALGLPAAGVLASISQGFGQLLGQIGLTVVLGTQLGVLLERSGAALRLALSVVSLVGPQRPAWAVAAIGYLVGIPVFCDSGFVLVSRIHAGLHARTGVPLPTLALALSSGVFATHTLVPPTPGPIAAAGNLGLGEALGWVMLVGALVALPATLVGTWLAPRLGTPATAANPAEAAPSPAQPESEATAAALPNLAAALASVAVPVLLIALGVTARVMPLAQGLAPWLTVLGHPLVALSIGLLLAAAPLLRTRRAELLQAIDKGVAQSGPILIITACGGAYGAVLSGSALADTLRTWLHASGAGGVAFLLVAFGVTALFKTAQGSTTAAMAIASSLLGALAPVAGFVAPLDLALVVAAVGAGAMVASHVNDSYFWIVCQFGGIAPKAGLRTQTLVTAAMGLSSLAMVVLLYALLHA